MPLTLDDAQALISAAHEHARMNGWRVTVAVVDEGGALLIFNAEDENEVREKLKNDPWTKHGILKLENVKRWEIFIDNRK